MNTTSHSQHSGLTLLVGLVVAALFFAVASTANADYGWPVKPFDEQHPVRGYFGDPRIDGFDFLSGTVHFGIDISAPNGTPVYATIDGTASINPLHSDCVLVAGAGGVTFEYWHIIPAISPGQRVTSYSTVVGRVEAPWLHVHFSERHGSTYVNPLRPDALAPYRDNTRPTVQAISFERNGAGIGSRLSGTVDLVTQAWDTTPVPVPAPWDGKPVTPALVEWKIVGARALTTSGSWKTADDFRDALPTKPFLSTYARWTKQNHRSTVARYRFFLAQRFDTRALHNGGYRLIVRVADTRGNAATLTRSFTVANAV